MRILFLNPPSKKGDTYMKELGRCGRRSVAGEIWPQTGLAYLAAVVEKEGHKAKIIDGMAVPLSVNELLEKIRVWRPQVIIVGTTTPTFKNDSEVVREILDSSDAILCFAGTHVSALPEQSLAESDADLIMINEAEKTIHELASLIEDIFKRSGKMDKVRDVLFSDGTPTFPLTSVRGIAYNLASKVHVTEPRGFIDDLDSLPMPARHLLPNERYKMPFFESEPFVTVIPTRGCPWSCTFCRAGGVWGKRVRTRSVANVLAEIKEIKDRYKIQNVVFMTDSLTLKRDWAMEFFQGILEDGLEFNWICNSRVDAVDAEMLSLMKRAGCRLISYGVESGSQEILDRCKKSAKLEDAVRAVKLTRNAGIISMAYFIIGLPGETRATIEQSIEFAKTLDPDYVNFHIATPFPGTEFYQEAKARGWLTSNDWNDYEEEGSAVVRTEDLSTGELVAAQRRAMRAFYLRPRRILKELCSLRRRGQLRAHLAAGLRMVGTLFGRK